MSVLPRQLAFALEPARHLDRDDFLESACNRDALATIDLWPDWPSRTQLLLGPKQSGKTHLAAIWAERAGARVVDAAGLSEHDLRLALATGALVVEDLAWGALPERGLFHLLNMAREDKAFVLLTAVEPPSVASFELADLASRLRAVPVATLGEPDEALLRAVLVKLFADRQIRVEESLIGYLVARIERSFAAANAVVDRLDREALRRGRPVTRPLAAEVLGAS